MAAEDSSKDSSSDSRRARKMMMRSSRDDSSCAHGGVYEDGPYKAHTVSLEQQQSRCGSKHSHRVGGGAAAATNETHLPPKPLLIAVPKAKGKYPVVQFQHGFTLQNHFYSQLLLHLASHGFIVVAPQMYTISGSDATTEIEDAVAILNWMPSGLEMALPSSFLNAKPDFSKVALVGHSRGGKVVFGLALGLRNSILQYSAVVGLDPVDGNAKGIQTQPPILRFSQHSLNLGVPTLIVGSGLGSLKRNYLFPPCAPEGVSHQAFFFDSSAPAFHFVAKEYGHMDFLDDDCKGAQGKLSYCVCKNGPSRSPMRRFAGGILAAFLQAALLNNTASFDAALAHPDLAPVLLEPPESYGKLPQKSQSSSCTSDLVIGIPLNSLVGYNLQETVWITMCPASDFLSQLL
jgi:chlorophyllase